MAVIKSGDSNNELKVNSDGAIRVVTFDSDGNEVPINLINTKVSTINSTDVPLGISGTWTGEAEDVSMYNAIIVSSKSDQNGTYYMEFSTNGIIWDSSLPKEASANVNDVHRLTRSKQYFRVRYVNGTTEQTYLRLQTIYGDMGPLTSPLNTVVSRDADAIVVRPLDFNLMMSEGLYEKVQVTIKDGVNEDIDTATVPEDLVSGGGVYAGFPTGTVEAAQCVVAGADTGTVYYTYLASPTSTDYVMGSVVVAGAGTYPLGHNIWRSNFSYFVSSNPAVFNVGTITIQNTPTVANIFTVIPTGYSQSYCAAYTVPYGSSVYLDRINGSVRGSVSGSLDGFFWYRPYGESPRLRFPFELQFGSLYFDDIDYLVKIPQQVDIVPRILTASVNNLSAKVSYRIVKIKT